MLTFVEFEGVPSSNNHAEREIRPAVLMRKASYGSQSERGAATRGVLMSMCRTLKNRRADLELALAALAPGGVLACHEYPDPDWPDVRRVVDEVATRAGLRRIRQSDYLGAITAQGQTHYAAIAKGMTRVVAGR